MNDLTDHRLQELIEAADDYAANHGSEIDHDITAALRELARLRGDLNMAAVSQAALEMRLRHRDAEIAELRAELTTAEAALESLQNKWASRPLSVKDTAALERENDALRAELAKTQCAVGDTPDSWAALVRDAAIGRWLLSQAEDYNGHACFPDVPYMCPDLRESVEEAMKEQQP